MAFVGQPFCRILVDICLYFKTYWSILLFISTYSFIWRNEICSSKKIGMISISRILFAIKPDERKTWIGHLVPDEELQKNLIFSGKKRKKKNI